MNNMLFTRISKIQLVTVAHRLNLINVKLLCIRGQKISDVDNWMSTRMNETVSLHIHI
jgi:hypothetical protein